MTGERLFEDRAMMRPWLAVLIPTYNGEAYLRSCLDSIAAQGDGSIECIAVDDGSTDATYAILESYADRLPLKLFTRRVGNWVANTNFALAQASAEYVCILHQDDLWERGRLATLKRLLENHPETGLVFHPSLFIDATGRRLGTWRCPFPDTVQVLPGGALQERLLVQDFIAVPGTLFRRQLAIDAGGLDESLWYTADWDFWLKLAGYGPVLYCPEPLSAFRVHAGSQTVQRSANPDEFRNQLETVLDRHLARLPSQNTTQVVPVARFSVEMNIALATAFHGSWRPLWHLLPPAFALGFSGLRRYLRDSRIYDRVAARIAARFYA